MIKNFLNLKRHQTPTSASKVTAILLKGWILPIGGASAGEGLPCSLRCKACLKSIRQHHGSLLWDCGIFEFFWLFAILAGRGGGGATKNTPAPNFFFFFNLK